MAQNAYLLKELHIESIIISNREDSPYMTLKTKCLLVPGLSGPMCFELYCELCSKVEF